MDGYTNFKINGPEKQLSPSMCDFCCKVFPNRYVRNFHVNNLHNIGMFYTCYICLTNPEVDKSEIYYNMFVRPLPTQRRVPRRKNYSAHYYLDTQYTV